MLELRAVMKYLYLTTSNRNYVIIIIIIIIIIIWVRIIAKSAYQLRHVRLSLRKYQRGSHWTHFREIWYRDIRKPDGWNPNLFKIGQKYQFTSWPTYVYGCRRHKLTLKEFLCNTQWRNIVDSDRYLNNKHVTNCNIVTATMVQWTRHMLHDIARLIFIIILIIIFLYIIASNSVGHMTGLQQG